MSSSLFFFISFRFTCQQLCFFTSGFNASRNRQLTILFMINCFMWIVLWGPMFCWMVVVNPQDSPYANRFQQTYTFVILVCYCNASFYLFCTINPIIFIICYKPVQQPLKSIVQKWIGRCTSSTSE